MSYEEYKKEIVEVARKAYARGLVPGSSGNISMKMPDTDLVMIKASGVPFRDMTEDDIVTMDLDGNVVEGSKKPSKEFRFHLGIYRVRADVGAVLHVHSPFATLYAVLGRPIPLVAVQAEARVCSTPVVDFAPAGSEKLAEMVINAYRDQKTNVILLRNHGVVIAEKDLREALNLAETIEDTALIAAFYEIISGLQKEK
jgi:L-fuculose-phosphate aldolase